MSLTTTLVMTRMTLALAQHMTNEQVLETVAEMRSWLPTADASEAKLIAGLADSLAEYAEERADRILPVNVTA